MIRFISLCSRFGPALLRLGLWVLFCGCETDYYLHLAAGQSRVVFNCESLDELLADPQLEDSTRARLAFVESVRLFARDQIGLETSTNYTCFFDTKGEPVSWNVSASPPDRFAPYQWRFPIVGAVPYKGFFDKERAHRQRDQLDAQGYDTILRPVSAYSTLGFFTDPVLSTMLDYPEDGLADLLIHELTHATIYVKGDTDFNESLATFVGRTGSLDFLAARYGEDSPQLEKARQRRADAARFRRFMQTVVTTLDSLYNLGLPRDEVLRRREEEFSRAKERFQELRSTFQVVSYDGFLQWKVNNARLLSYRRYNRDLSLFEQVHARKGNRLDQMLTVVTACSDSGDPWACLKDSAASAAPRMPATE